MVTIENRAPGSCWPTRRDLSGGYVMTMPDDQLRIVVREGGEHAVLYVDRREARLLAKRINQCLDATAKS